MPRLEDFDDDAAARRSGSSLDAWLFPALLVLVPLLGFGDWAIVREMGAADALECARTDCSFYQDMIRTIAVIVIPGLIVIALLAAVPAGIRFFRR